MSILVISIITIVGTVSYAYFTATGEVRKQEATISTGTVNLTFSDNDLGLNAELAFGESVTKKFTMGNTGTADSRVKMSFNEMVNTYLEGSLTYTLSYSENVDGPYTEVVSKTNVPQSKTSSKKALANSLAIPAGKTYYYNLVVTLNYLEDVNQDADLNAVFNTKFIVEDINVNEDGGPAYETLKMLGGTSKGKLSSFAEIAPEVTRYADGGFGKESNYSMSLHTNNYYTYSDSYTFDESTGKYTLVNPAVCQYSSCYETLKGKYIADVYGSTSNSVADSSNLGKIYKVGTSTTLTSMSRSYSSRTEVQFDYSKDGVYEMSDDYGTSYYYRGAVTNNYVKFAGFYWRIIRINGDGSLRILYDGTQAYENGVSDTERTALTGVAWNLTNENDAKYVGYMYGGANGMASTSKGQAQTNETDTNIKTKLEEWYVANIESKGHGDAVADAIFCNDRSTPDSSHAGGFANNSTYYGASNRLVNTSNWSLKDNPQPTFACPQKNDTFTVNDTEKGNGALTYPVGLITADELVAAGGKYYTLDGLAYNNKNHYLYKGASYWSISPRLFSSSANVFIVIGDLSFSSVNSASAVVPVINLSAEYVSTLIGDGTMTNPYRQQGEAV